MKMRALGLGLAAVAGGAAILAIVVSQYASVGANEKRAVATPQKAGGAEASTAVQFPMHPSPVSVPELSFLNKERKEISLQEFKGQTIILNVWATWCVPCRKEMPALDRLEAKLGSSKFQVVPLSIDRNGLEKVEKFYRELHLDRLPIFVDETGKAPRVLATVGIPTTLLIDPNGREIGRQIGPAEWDSPSMIAFLERQIRP